MRILIIEIRVHVDLLTMPNTPFIPPLNTPEGSPISGPPVIPGGGGSPNMPQGQGWGASPNTLPAAYPTFSPYQNASPFIPSSPFVAPGVIPGQSHTRNNSRQGLSSDWTGYPQGTPFTSPTLPLPGGQPPQNPMYNQPQPQAHPTSPWHNPSTQAGYPAFGGSPWPGPPQPFPPAATPWGMPRGLPPQMQAYTPWAPPAGIPPPAPAAGGWGMPPSFFPPQESHAWMPQKGGMNFQPPSIPRGPPDHEPIPDRLDSFMEGDSCKSRTPSKRMMLKLLADLL